MPLTQSILSHVFEGPVTTWEQKGWEYSLIKKLNCAGSWMFCPEPLYPGELVVMLKNPDLDLCLANALFLSNPLKQNLPGWVGDWKYRFELCSFNSLLFCSPFQSVKPGSHPTSQIRGYLRCMPAGRYPHPPFPPKEASQRMGQGKADLWSLLWCQHPWPHQQGTWLCQALQDNRPWGEDVATLGKVSSGRQLAGRDCAHKWLFSLSTTGSL